MKKILNLNNSINEIDTALLIMRIGIAVLMLTHGIPKLFMLFSGEPVKFPSVLGLSAGMSLSLAVISEVICSILLLIGFGTRVAAIPLIITMLIAAFIFHGADPLVVKEPALHYLLVYVVLFFAGPGRYSFDNWYGRSEPVSVTP